MPKHLATIDAFRCAVEIDHPPNPREVEIINATCRSQSLAEGIAILRNNAGHLSRDGLEMLTTCAVGLWQDQKRSDIALAVCSWALETARLLKSPQFEADILYMQIGLLLANKHFESALDACKTGSRLCEGQVILASMAAAFAEAERRVEAEKNRASLELHSCCAVCKAAFRVQDGARHLVLSWKPETMTKAAHCFNCNIVICFRCAAWEQAEEASSMGGEFAKDLRTPVCPFCSNVLGISPHKPQSALLKLQYMPPDSVSLLASPTVSLQNSDLSLIRLLFGAREMSSAVDIIRAAVNDSDSSLESRLANASGALSNSSRSEFADFLTTLARAIEWVRKKQIQPAIDTNDVFHLKPQCQAPTADSIEEQLSRVNMLLERGELARALHEIEAAAENCRAIRDDARLSRSHLIMGLIRQQTAENDRAIQEFETALRIAEHIGNDLIAAKCHGNLASCFSTSAADNIALQHSTAALRLYRKVDNDIGIGRTLNNIAAIHLKRGEPRTAITYLEEAYELKKKGKDYSGAANTIGNLASAHAELGDCDLACTLGDEAVEMARLSSSPLELARHLIHAGLFAERADREDTATERLEEAIEIYGKTRTRISDKDIRDNLTQQFRPYFEQLSRLHLSAGRISRCIEVLESFEAIGLAEFMAHPENMKLSREHPGGEFVAEFPLAPLSIQSLWSAIVPTLTAVIKFAFISQELHALLALPNRAVGDWVDVVLPAGNYDALHRMYVEPPKHGSTWGGGWFGPLHDFRAVIGGRIKQHEMTTDAFGLFARDRLINVWEPLLLEFGTRIFAPLLKTLRDSGASQILFIPTEFLNSIPLHALRWHESRGEKCVIEEFDASVSPSLRIFLQAKNRGDAKDGETLLLSDPIGDLPDARLESRIIAGITTPSRMLEGTDATFEAVEKSRVRCRILHCATHGTYDPVSATRCGIFLAAGEDSEAALGKPVAAKLRSRLVSVPDLFQRLYLQEGALVYLSCCEGGSPMPYTKGNDFVSLSAAFLAAGANTVICSQWPVDSLFAAICSVLFYLNLQNDDSIAALSSTQRFLRSATVDEICARWNHDAATGEHTCLNPEKLSLAIGKSLDTRDRPFADAYYWASFGHWGPASTTVSESIHQQQKRQPAQ